MDGPPRPLTFGERIVHSLLFLIFAAVGLIGTLALLWGIWQRSAVYRWTPAECAVVSSSVEEHPEAGKDTGAFRFVVSYAYTFGSQRHLSNQYAPGYRGSSAAGGTSPTSPTSSIPTPSPAASTSRTAYDLLGRSSADTDGKQAKIVKSYSVGARTVCYVNPKDPDDAVLSKDWSTFHPARFLPLAMLLLGIGGMVKTLRGTWGDPDASDPDVSP